MNRSLLLPVALLASACAGAAAATDLQTILDAQADYFNVSVSAAITLPNGKVIAAAAGFDDHAAGTTVTTASLYPSGSVTKTFSATAAMRLVEEGKLALTAPIHTVVDPWLKAQGEPSLLHMWDGDATINAVTVEHLLQMRSGVPDYDDNAVRTFSIANPDKDWLPSNYVANVSKHFLFTPGKGGAYSGVGYVLLGWVLCAASDGCHKWSDLDQAALVQTKSFKLDGAIFMGAGPCSDHPSVVHQYCFSPGAKAGEQPQLPLLAPPPRQALELQLRRLAAQAADGASDSHLRGGAVPSHCSATHPDFHSWWPGKEITGPTLSQRKITSGGASACCAAGDVASEGASIWSFIPDASGSDAGVCKFFALVEGLKPVDNHAAVSGRTNAPLSLDNFVDLHDASCLNGWTMGNIAANPAGVTQFYHALFVAGGLLSPASVARMQQWQPLTSGFEPGEPYGFGLMKDNMRFPLKGIKECGALPACKCGGLLFKRCYFDADSIGHAGLDYGSGMPIIGHFPALNVSYAWASNTGEQPMGMNTTLGVMENLKMLSGTTMCSFMETVVKAAVPEYADFECGGW